MINRLKKKFLLAGTVFMFILMTVLVLIMNLVNFYEVTSDADSVLDVLLLPVTEEQAFPRDPADAFVPHGMSPEVPYESRFFIVLVSSEGEIMQSDLSRIVSVTDEEAKEYIRKALDSGSERGFLGNFRYARVSDENGTRILFLDCGRKLDSFRGFLWISVIVGLSGCIVVFVAFALTSGKIVAPIAESYEKQKRFISDAGHEIKTPLTIINANVDLLESDGEKEELADIRQQTKRLTALTNNLILLSRMEESASIQKIVFPLSDMVSETVASFRGPAASRDLVLSCDAAPGVTINGSPDLIRQLVSILMENAVKYAPDGGAIRVKLTAHKKSAVFSVTNTARDTVNESDLPRVFDRFYRSDVSRNSGTGGHGIGLSIAKAITEAHGGSITASTDHGRDFTVTVILPM